MRMKIARVLPLILVLTVAFAAACPVPVEIEIELTEEELVQKVIAAWGRVDTFLDDYETTIVTTWVVSGETIESSTLKRSYYKMDIANQRMMDTTIKEITMPPEPGVPEEVIKIKTEMYRLDGMMYMKVAMPGMPPMWTKVEMPWVCYRELIAALFGGSEIEILGVEEVAGIESYLVEVVLDPLHWMMVTGMDFDPAAMDIDLEEMFEKLTMQTWICRNTFLPVKEQIQTTIVFEGTEKQMNIISRPHSFNEPVTIQLPPEAAEAIEIPEW